MKKKLFIFSIILLGLIFVLIVGNKLDQKKIPNCFALLNSHYFDYKTNSYISDQTIIIKNSVIADIISADNKEAVTQLKCHHIDLDGAYLYPGLIDAHTHLMAADKQRLTNWKSTLELSAARPDEERLRLGEMNARSMLFAGFTTARDLGNSGYFLDMKLDESLKTLVPSGPEIITSGPGLAVTPSQINLKFNPKEYLIIDENSQIDKILQEYRSHGVTWLKLYADNSDSSSLMNPNLLNEITREAQKAGFKVAIHSEFGSSATRAIKASPDSIEHFFSVPDGNSSEYPKNLPYVVVTEYSLQTCLRAGLDQNCEKRINTTQSNIKWLKKHNFKIVFGSDAVLDFTSKFNTRGEASIASLISLGELGLSPLEVMLSATAVPAEMLDLPIGKIEKNHTANLVAYKKDPLVDLENLKQTSLIMFKGDFVCKNLFECRYKAYVDEKLSH